MKLKDCVFGILVTTTDDRKVGMIKGITNNKPSGDLTLRSEKDNAIPLVEWSCGETYGIHHENIKPLK